MKPLPNEKSYKSRLEMHQFAACVWASLAKEARDLLHKESLLHSRERIEEFIVRAIARALRHYREADRIRRRGHS